MILKNPIFSRVVAAGLAAIFVSAGSASAQQGYYKKGYAPIFNPFPRDSGRGSGNWNVRNFGPAGIGITLTRPGMTMQINNVEAGSPAEKTGKLKKGQIIESINGVVLKDIDPREILGDIITAAEAKDGKLNMKIKGEGVVTVQIPIMGAYSPTWPLNCKKSDMIVRNLAAVLAKQEKPRWGSVLFLLSTGNDQDLEVVKRWMKNADSIYGNMNWATGYNGLGLCEYYLRTGDKTVLPVIKRLADQLKANMYSGGWSGRGAPAAFTYSTGSGQVHASGVNCMTFLLMAKLCGVEVDKYTFDQSFAQFYRFAGHGNVAYGNTDPEGGFRDNGKSSGLACALGAAALVDPRGEDTVFAKARDNSAMKAFYATNWFHAAHTGGGMGEIWHHAAMKKMREKRPKQYRSYFDTRRWVMELSRRHDGSIGIAGMDDRYDRSATEQERSWGTFFALTYTLPRKHLQLFGAPRSKFAVQQQLKRPWGNAGDDIFHSIEPIPGGPLTMEFLLDEKVGRDDSAGVVFNHLSGQDVTDETLQKYFHHPEYGIRCAAIRTANNLGRSHLVLPLLKSKDARLREVGLLGMIGMFKGRSLPQDQLTPEMFAEVSKMVNNPEEGWWVAHQAIKALGRADKKFIGQHRDRLIEFINYYDSTYVKAAACITLSKIACEPEHYKKTLPVVLEQVSKFRVSGASWQTSNAIANAIKGASPEVKKFASPMIGVVYKSVPAVVKEPHTGAVFGRGGPTIRKNLGAIAKSVPGGEDFVRKLPKETLASYKSGKESDQFRFSGTHQANPKVEGTWEWCIWPAANKPEEVMPRIEGWVKNQTKGGKALPNKVDRPKDTLQIQKGGGVRSKFYGGYFYSGDMLIGVDAGQAVKMQVVTVSGRDFLVVERGGFNAEPKTEEEATAKVPADYHCGFHIYMKRK